MNKEPEFNKHYGEDSIEYRFKFYNLDEREIHKKIIHHLVEELSKLKLHKDNLSTSHNKDFKENKKDSPKSCPNCGGKKKIKVYDKLLCIKCKYDFNVGF